MQLKLWEKHPILVHLPIDILVETLTVTHE